MDSMITTFNTAVTETAKKLLGKHSQNEKPWVTAEILDVFDKRRELRKKIYEPEGSEKYWEMSNSIKKSKKPRRSTASPPLYVETISAILFDGNIGDWFRTTVGVRQG